jgi:hypothetical protein
MRTAILMAVPGLTIVSGVRDSIRVEGGAAMAGVCCAGGSIDTSKQCTTRGLLMKRSAL